MKNQLTATEKALAYEHWRALFLETRIKYPCPEITIEKAWCANASYVYRNAVNMKGRLSPQGFARYLKTHEPGSGWKIYSEETGKHVPI